MFIPTAEKHSNQTVTQKQPPEVFYKKGILRNFAKFTGKRLCQRLFFNKVAGLRRTTPMAASEKGVVSWLNHFSTYVRCLISTKCHDASLYLSVRVVIH